jgi:4'-phosphopantetheinyl transferase
MKLFWLEQQQSDLPASLDWLGPSETLRLEGMRFPKRRADWLLGRWTAKHAVAGFLGYSAETRGLAAIEILAAPSGEPRVFADGEPLPVAISISHRAGVAICVVAAVGANIGCDLELVERRSEAFASDYFSVDEQRLIVRYGPSQRDLFLNLLWSSKESAMKALHQGLRLDPRSIRISWKPHAECLPFATWAPLRARYDDECDFCGYWSRSGNLLRTVVAEASSLDLVAIRSNAKA